MVKNQKLFQYYHFNFINNTGPLSHLENVKRLTINQCNVMYVKIILLMRGNDRKEAGKS